MKIVKSYYLLVFSILLTCAFSANILFIYGGANLSHKTSIWPLVIALADRGHKITFISSTEKQSQQHPNVTDFAPAELVKISKQLYDVNRIEARKNFEERRLYEMYSGMALQTCKLILYEPELIPMFETGSFDLVFINAIYGECGYLIAQYFGAKYVVSSSTFVLPWFFQAYGVLNEASTIPDMVGTFTYPMGLFDRMKNVYYYFNSERDLSFTQGMEDLMMERFKLTKVPTFEEMEKNASLVFLNGHHTLDFARSLPPLFVDIGGMGTWEATKDLPPDFQEFMDGAEEGVVLITFGSTMDLSIMPPDYRMMFYNMMNKFNKVRFIWRWSEEVPNNQPQNLMSSKWLPQKEIMKHPKLKAFMTHGGINSLTEATYFGIPLIVTPFFGDQDYNSFRIVAQEVGLLLESRSLTQEIVDTTFKEILTNPKYKRNMEARSRMIRDRPLSPTETAVYWTEFVLRHDDMSSFKPLSASQSLFVRNSLDVYFMFILIFCIFPLILLRLLILLVRRLIK